MAKNGESIRTTEEIQVPLLEHSHASNYEENNNEDFKHRIWVESKKLWRIVGPAIISRITSYSMIVISQAFAGHLGNTELAAISIAGTAIIGFDFGLLVKTPISSLLPSLVL